MISFNRTVGLLATLLILAYSAYLAPATAQNSTPTVQECEDAWSDSSASSSCGIPNLHDPTSISVNSQGQCYVEAECHTYNWGNFNITQTSNDTSFAGTKDEVKRLENCQGTLKVDSC